MEVSHLYTKAALSPRKDPQHQSDKRPDGPQSQYRHGGEESNSYLWCKSNPGRPNNTQFQVVIFNA